MKNITKLAAKGIILSMVFSGGVVVAASGDDETYRNMTLEERLYQYDGFGAQWGLDVGSDGLWLVPSAPVGGTYSAPFKLRNDAADNTLVIGSNRDGMEGNVGIGTDTPYAKLDVRGDIAAAWSGSNTTGDGATQLLALSANNAAAGKTSDAGFSMENVADDFQWSFRTYSPEEGFAATKIGTSGPEFEVANTTTNFRNAVVRMGGVTVFTNGHLVTASSRSLKTDIKPLDTQAALDAFHQLQPVSFAYKAHQGEPVVGFIAEDMPELVAMPSKKSFDSAEVVAVLTSVLAETRAEMKAKDVEMEAMKTEIAKLKVMQQKVAQLESVLTNLALETSDTKREKVSVNLNLK